MPTSTTTHAHPISVSSLSAYLSTAKIQIYTDNPSNSSQPPSRGLNTFNIGLRNPQIPSSGGYVSGGAIRTLAWSPTGSLIATADARVLRVWNPEKVGVKFSTELRLPVSSSTSAAVTAGGNGGGMSSRTAMSMQSGQDSHLVGTERVAWNPAKEAELASVGSDGVLRFWDVRAKEACVGEVVVGGEGFSLAWRPDGSEIVVGRKDDTLIPVSRHTLSATAHHQQTVQTNQIAFSNSGNEILLTTGDSQVKILDYPSMATLHTLQAHTSSCYVVVPSPSGRHLAIGGSDALITLWDTSDFVCRHSLSSMTGPVRSLSFSFDGRFIVGGSDEGSGIVVSHVESGEQVFEVKTQGATPCVAWSPRSYALANGGEGGLKIVGV